MPHFLEMMSAERGASLNTLDAYRRDLIRCIRVHGRRTGYAQPKQIAAYMAELARAALRPPLRRGASQRSNASFVSCSKSATATDNPTSQIDGPKTRRDVPDVLSREEMVHLLRLARNGCAPDLPG